MLPYCEIDLKPDGVLYIRSASGGGYGDPLERDPKLVAEDFSNGLISKETAEEIYGVILDENGLAPNLAATQNLRLRFRQERSEGVG